MRFEQLDLRLEQRFQAQSKSLDAALIAADLKSNALADKIGSVSLDLKEGITRQEYDSQHKGLLDKIDDLRARYYEQAGISSGANVAQRMRDINNQLADLKQSRDSGSGKDIGSQVESRLLEQTHAINTINAKLAEGSGKDSGSNIEARVVDLANEIRNLRDYKQSDIGKSLGINSAWIVLVGLMGVMGVVATLIAVFKP